MIPRTVKRVSSSSSASARAGIRSLVLSADKTEEQVYQSKTFDDGDASPSPAGTPLGSRRSSATAASFGVRRDSLRMTSITPDSPTTASAARAFSTSAVTSAPSPIIDSSSIPSAPGGSYEHGSYQFTPKELAAVKKRVEEEFLLKTVTRRPLAQQRRPEGKVPFEFTDSTTDEVRHPSGFVVPAPGEAPAILASESRLRSPEIVTQAVAEGVLSFADLKTGVTADQRTQKGKVPQEITNGDGIAMHPSGFIPPSAQTANMEGMKDVFKPGMKLTSASQA